MSNELPEPWGSELGGRGIHSYRDMSEKIGGSHETMRRLVNGGATSPKTVKRVADEWFGGDRAKVWELRGQTVHDHGDWELPPEASLLNDEQRRAILSVVKAMLPAKEIRVPETRRRSVNDAAEAGADRLLGSNVGEDSTEHSA